jgi:predicted transcriptional regulator
LTVLQFIADNGPIAGREVMDATGLPSGTVNHCCRDLKSDKLISGVLADAPGPRGGHRAMIWTVSKKGLKRLQAL